MTDAAKLSAARRHYLVAPAGFGKTHLIAEAIAKHPSSKRQLVLTHTHAGVASLRAKLRELRASPSAYRVDTIAGWCLEYVTAFPHTSGLAAPSPEDDAAWCDIYTAMASLVDRRWVQDIIRLSYDGIYVDEYQDCTLEQHYLITRLASVLPCRVLGDPMQGIFSFARAIDWEKHVTTEFEQLPELTTPWRWIETNPGLGNWLLSARRCLASGAPLSLRNPALEWRCLPQDTPQMGQLAACKRALAVEGSVIAILKWASQCHGLGKKLSGRYSCVEKVDCKELYDFAEKIESSSGPSRVAAIIEFAKECMIHLPKLDVNKSVKPRSKYYRLHEAMRKAAISTNDDLHSSVLEALDALQSAPEVAMFRRELFEEMRHSLREYGTGRFSSLREAARYSRNASRRTARPPRGRLLGRTLLVKGLQFDHAIVLDADALDVRNLYVAITRGARSLTVLSKNPVITPRWSV